MQKNHSNFLILCLFVAVFMISCSFDRGSVSGQPENTARSSDERPIISPKQTAAVCPPTTLSVAETKNKALEKYEGCLVSVEGKIWAVTANSITLIDSAERTDYNHSLFIGGSFSSGTYSEIGSKISRLKINGQYEKLPVATFTGTVETVSGYTSLKNSVLTGVVR